MHSSRTAQYIQMTNKLKEIAHSPACQEEIKSVELFTTVRLLLPGSIWSAGSLGQAPALLWVPTALCMCSEGP